MAGRPRAKTSFLVHIRLLGGDVIKLIRPRYGGSASTWGFALYLASTDEYQDAILPTSGFADIPEDALACACGLYLTDPIICPAPHTTQAPQSTPEKFTEPTT
ncbi:MULTISPECIES: hypothetical protein [Streptomyces]|uniref:hypothetical protein n=1 Tax=Streptomyces TaxID=1883 RepID=UPI000B9DDDB1|nr:hypothetical protein [Streptomyces kasugaensis]